MDKAKRYELRMKGTLIFVTCVCVLAIVLQMFGVLTGQISAMSASIVGFTTAQYSFANGAIKALKQEIESLKSDGSDN